MTAEGTIASITEAPGKSGFRAVTDAISRSRLRGIRPGVALSWAFIATLAVASLAPSLLAPGDPLEVDPTRTFIAPGAAHWFGTDESGSDVYTRIVHGAGASLVIGITATVIGLLIGIAVGLTAGLGNRLVEASIMRVLDVTLAVPELLLALVVIGIIGGGTINAILAIGAGGVAYYARIVRAQTHKVRSATYVEAARTLGFSRSKVVFRHVLPNAIKPVLILATIGIGGAIGAGASLSFLGLGTPRPRPSGVRCSRSAATSSRTHPG
ncbi:ABC transporter permease [Agromyces protaetiae]|uniref:ABC transporter permease n=1 Tax=Agromyces protaetiae TaxID=2509455 RepID=UPI001AA01152|nr:ABC transporter permease [Agromyces protaetiae]